MNVHIKNLNRIEFMLTLACTGQCKHCSEGEHSVNGEHINGDVAASIVRKISEKHRITSLMTFGGEPLLYPNDVCKIHKSAKDSGIAERTLITNGFFSRDEKKIFNVAESLVESGVNGILLSIDAFHQETIPLDPVMMFAKAVKELCVPEIKVHPAWLVSRESDNSYNKQTRELLEGFNKIGIPTSDGNVIFPSGNALKYLSKYFDLANPQISPYYEDPQDIKAICVSPNGDVLDGNIYRNDILEILETYNRII